MRPPTVLVSVRWAIANVCGGSTEAAVQGRGSPVLAMPGWTGTRAKRQGHVAPVSKVFPTEQDNLVVLLFEN